MRWLITGGLGFIGTNLIARLVKNSPVCRIRVLDNLSAGSLNPLRSLCSEGSRMLTITPAAQLPPADSNRPIPHGDPEPVQVVVGDIRDRDTCFRCCRDIDTIVHLAANTGVEVSVRNPRIDLETNVIGTFNLLEAASDIGVHRFVFASSGACLGNVPPPITEEKAPHPISPYGAGKLAGEGYCSAFTHAFGLKTMMLRFSNVYGPFSDHKQSVVSRFIQDARKSGCCTVFGDGNQTRDFIFVDDLVDALLKVSQYDGGGEIFQIATGHEHSIKAVAEMIRSRVRERCGIDMEIHFAGARDGDVRRNYSDTAKAMRLLNWRAQTPLTEGIDRTIHWFFRGRGSSRPDPGPRITRDLQDQRH